MKVIHKVLAAVMFLLFVLLTIACLAMGDLFMGIVFLVCCLLDFGIIMGLDN